MEVNVRIATLDGDSEDFSLPASSNVDCVNWVGGRPAVRHRSRHAMPAVTLKYTQLEEALQTVRVSHGEAPDLKVAGAPFPTLPQLKPQRCRNAEGTDTDKGIREHHGLLKQLKCVPN